MSVQWTKEQLDAIEARGGNILVAAAAGSGKTAVLVERIIRRITDEKNPVSVDRLLVLTFTDAAAAEMKRKIAAAIDKKLEENPDNEWLREQSIKVNSACISTIHSFCSRIIVNNAHLTDLPADFSLIDTTENDVLLHKALDDVLESYYSRIDKKQSFAELVTGWGGIKGDDALREKILKLHSFSRSLAYPKRWLHRAWADGYGNIAKGGLIENSVWRKLLTRELYSSAENIAEALELMWRITDNEVPSDHKYFEYYRDLRDGFCEVFYCIDVEAEESFDKLCDLLGEFSIPAAPRKTGLDEWVAERISSLRDSIVKVELKKSAEMLSAINEENVARIVKCSPVIRMLCMIVRQVDRLHMRYKRERSAIDFGDLEHGLLRLICNERGEETPLCRRLRDYYDEILLDEFQDTNVLQFEIFKRLSKKEGSLFMVGDVKQCIYKFRNADPSIFMRLYKAYSAGDGGRLIRLFKNFRSRSEVVDSVNYIFSAVMSERVGGIDYTEEEYLIRGASYPDCGGFDTEIMITDLTGAGALRGGFAEMSDEATNIANRIYRLVCDEKMMITDKETGELRSARFGDIVVLVRNKAVGDAIEAALLKRGITAVSDSGQQYLGSAEVMTVLYFLQIIDNPVQDIPLIAVMRSPLFAFSAEELAKIRTYAKKGNYFFALKAAAEENPKAAEFLKTLNELRECARYMGVDELVRKICVDLHYFSVAAAMPGGELRKANLKLLLERASAYEQGALTGLFNFMKYIEMLRENGKDIASAKAVADGLDAVRIMTIHRSKGLEFPIVVMASASKRFNVTDISNNIIWDEKFGIGLDYMDTRQRVRYSFPLKKLVANELYRSLIAEEMRLLYVAMTRAKEKLIISATIKDKENRWRTAEFDEKGRLYPCIVAGMNTVRDWIWGALLKHPDAQLLRENAERYDIVPKAEPYAPFRVIVGESGNGSTIRTEVAEASEDKLPPDAADRLDYKYPYALLGQMPIKLSVSELKRRQMPEEDYITGLLKPQLGFLNDKAELTAAERGTVTHFVLQHMDIQRGSTVDEIKEQIEEMVKSGMLTRNQGESVNINSVHGFFTGELGKRLRASGKFEREFDFYMLVSPDEVDKNASCGEAEEVILQGIADCFFYEDDGIVLLDYKTDRVGKSDALARSEIYRTQIDYYARGLSEILDVPVKEKYIYFLGCGEAVRM